MSAHPQRVLHYFGNQGMTGVEIFVLNLAVAQRALGIDARITCHPKGRASLLTMAEQQGVPVIPFILRATSRSSSIAGKINRLLLTLKRITLLAQELRRETYDALHIHTVGIACLPAFISGILAQKTHMIVTHHTSVALTKPTKNLRTKIIFWLERHFSFKVVMPYQQAAHEIIAAGMPRAKVETVPFCIDFAKFSYEPSKANICEPFRFMISARLVKGKGHAELLQAMQQLVRRIANIKLTISGDGPLHDEIMTEITCRNLNNCVTLIGYVPHDQMPKLMREHDAMVLPSYMLGETFPICLLETAALGLPAIATHWYGIPDIVLDQQTGLLVQPGDVAGLEKALEFMALNRLEAHRMGRMARERSRALFDCKIVANSYSSLYK